MKWFIHQNKKVHGPYSQNEVDDILRQKNLIGAFVWTRGLAEWLPTEAWSPQNIQKLMHQAAPAHTPASATATQVSSAETRVSAKNMSSENTTASSAKTTVQSMAPTTPSSPSEVTQAGGLTRTIALKKNTQRFKVQYDFVDQGYMNLDELLEYTSKQVDHSKIAVYDQDKKEWREVYSIAEVSERLGITRRKNARVPIMAQFSGTTDQGEKINSRVITVSIGGMGLSDNFNLTVGELMSGQISSPHFFTPLNVSAEVTYTGQDGYIGLKFTQLNDDALALITEYVKKFSQAES